MALVSGSSYTVTDANGGYGVFTSEMVPAPVENVDQVYVTVSGGGGGGGKPSFSQATRVVEAKLLPSKESRVAEVDLTPDVHVVPKNKLIPTK